MQILARVAAAFVFGLATFHSYGTLLVTYSLLSRREVHSPVFFIRGHSEQTVTEYTTMIVKVGVASSIIATILLCLTVNLWKRKLWSWWSSIAIVGLILLSHANAIQWLAPSAQIGHRNLITYGVLTLTVLLLSAPTFLNQARTTT